MRREAVQSALDSAARIAGSLDAEATRFESDTLAARLDIENAFSRLPAQTPAVALQKQQALDAKKQKMSDELDAPDSAFRARRLELVALEKEIRDAEKYYERDVSVLDRSSLDSPRRATYSQNLASGGPASVRSACERAIAERDPDLAAAAIAALDKLPAGSRPFDAAHVAKACLPPWVAETREKLRLARLNLARGHAAIFKVRGGSSAGKIAQGLENRVLEKRAHQTHVRDGGATAMIAAGLDARGTP